MKKKLYLVETISFFRHRYVVEAKEATHATDETVMNVGTSNENWKEFSQAHIDETVTSVRDISIEEYLKLFDKDNDYLRGWTNKQKLAVINTIDYKDEE